MFFFQFSYDQANGINPTFVGEPNDIEIDFRYVREKLQRETEKQGLRNNDLAELTGWSASKTSKIVAGKQNITMDDVRMWSRALGYTPDPFIDNRIDFREYELSSFIRPLGKIVDAYWDADDEIIEKAIIQYEFPLAILSALCVNYSDYSVRANTSSRMIITGDKHDFGFSPAYIRFWQRTTKEDGVPTPEFGLWISPENEYFFFSVYINNLDDKSNAKALRQKYKNLLQIEEAGTEAFEEFAQRNQEWIPSYVVDGEVFSFGSDTNCFPAPENIANVFVELFKKYCALVWEVKGIDLMPDRLRNREALTVYEQYEILNGYADFYPETKDVVKQKANYQCQFSKEHSSFIGEDGRPYMEVAPLIPFTHGSQYGKAIISEANAVCLCPNCNAELKHGRKINREDMITALHRLKREELSEAGIDMRISQILQANGL